MKISVDDSKYITVVQFDGFESKESSHWLYSAPWITTGKVEVDDFGSWADRRFGNDVCKLFLPEGTRAMIFYFKLDDNLEFGEWSTINMASAASRVLRGGRWVCIR